MEIRSVKKNKGITIFFALIVISSLLLMTFFIVELARKEVIFSIFSRESQVAFYAAESGIECAWYWDNSGDDSESSPFWNGSTNGVYCGDGFNLIGQQGSYEFNFLVDGDEGSYVEVSVDIEDNNGSRGKTTIISTGYNTADEDAPRRFERRIELTYDD